jgi:hypothetical protein
LEERILGTGRGKKNPIQPGEHPILLVLGDEQQQGQDTVEVLDRMELGGERISFRDLTQWLMELNSYANKLTRAWG